MHGFIERRIIHTSANLGTTSTSSFLARVDFTLVFLGLSLLCAALCIFKYYKTTRNRVFISNSHTHLYFEQSSNGAEPRPRDLDLEVSGASDLSAPPGPPRPSPLRLPHNDAVTATGSQLAEPSNQPRNRGRSARFACPFLVYDPEKYKAVESCSPMMTIDEVSSV